MTVNEIETKPKGSGPWYAGFVVALGVSVDTSWRFFGERLHITDVRERVLLFAVVEVMLLAAAWSMRAGVRRDGRPGSARMVAWMLCAMQGYMALDLSGPVIGAARVALGSGLALVALHQALGIEIKTRIGQRSGTWARIGRELRERALSRLGLSNDERDALARTRDRAAERAARLATAPHAFRRRARLAKAVRVAGVAVDEAMKIRMLAHVAAYGNLAGLVALDLDSPWTSAPVPVPSVPVPSVPRPRVAPTSGGPAIGWDLDKVVRLVQEGRPDEYIQSGHVVSAKTLQRTRRVVRAIASGQADEDIVRGDITAKFVGLVRAAMEVTA